MYDKRKRQAFIADIEKPVGRGLIVTKNSIEKHMSIGLLTQIIVKGNENFSHQGGIISKIPGTKNLLGGGLRV